VIIEITLDAGELERAFYHAERRVAVPIHDPIGKRARDSCPDSALFAKIDKWCETLVNPTQFTSLRMTVGYFLS
jgi:hypothetical protein